MQRAKSSPTLSRALSTGGQKAALQRLRSSPALSRHGAKSVPRNVKSPASSKPPLSPREACRFLEKYRDDCVDTWDYQKACEVNARLEDFKRNRSIKKNTDMFSQQGAMQHAMMARHAQELNEFKRTWQRKMQQFANWEAFELKECHTRHKEEFEEHIVEMHQDAAGYHFGKEVTNLRCRTKYLAGMQRYADAAVMQARADGVAYVEHQLFLAKQDEQRACGGKGPFALRQSAEHRGLETRLAAQRRDLEKKWRWERDLLKTRQQNERTKMSSLHVRQQQCASGKRPSSAPTLIRPSSAPTLTRSPVSRPSSAAETTRLQRNIARSVSSSDDSSGPSSEESCGF